MNGSGVSRSAAAQRLDPVGTTTRGPGLPVVAVGYGPRAVPPMRIAEAAAGVCELIWLVDRGAPDMVGRTELLARFGTVLDVSGRDRRALVEELRAYEVKGMVPYVDAAMIELSELAEELELPFHSTGTARALVDKALQGELLAASGLPVPRHVVLPQPAGRAVVESLAGAISWPAVLKPRADQGSRATFLVHDAGEVAGLVDSLGSPDGEMLLEEYLAGAPDLAAGPYADYLSVESIVTEGEISHLALTGRFPPTRCFRETGFFIPAVVDRGVEQAIVDNVTVAIHALGVRWGVLHTELELTASGPRILEVNGRAGGGVPEMLTRAAGLPLLQLTLRVALGERIRIEGPVATDRIGYRFFLQPTVLSGSVHAIEGVDALADHPSVETVTIHRGPGSKIDWREGTRGHILSVAGAARDAVELTAVEWMLREIVKVTYDSVGS